MTTWTMLGSFGVLPQRRMERRRRRAWRGIRAAANGGGGARRLEGTTSCRGDPTTTRWAGRRRGSAGETDRGLGRVDAANAREGTIAGGRRGRAERWDDTLKGGG